MAVFFALYCIAFCKGDLLSRFLPRVLFVSLKTLSAENYFESGSWFPSCHREPIVASRWRHRQSRRVTSCCLGEYFRERANDLASDVGADPAVVLSVSLLATKTSVLRRFHDVGHATAKLREHRLPTDYFSVSSEQYVLHPENRLYRSEATRIRARYRCISNYLD